MPNNNFLSFYHYQDIQIQDASIKQQYVNYFKNGQYTEALNLLNNNATQLEGKAFISNLLNIIFSGVFELENQYNESVPLFLSNLYTQYSLLINNFTNKNIWKDNENYIPYNFVIYNNDIYMCIKNSSAGTLPTDENYWLFLGMRGDEGTPGINVNMRYQWDYLTSYNINDIVVYGSNIYVALSQNVGVMPGSDDNIWEVFLITNPRQIYIGTTSPKYPIQNTLWFKTSVDPLVQTTDSPLIGQFYRYNTSINDWEEMYPNIFFKWLDGFDNYAPTATYIDLNIQPSQWINGTYTYQYPFITNNSIVNILPGKEIDINQYLIYNSLNLFINETNIILTTNMSPTTNVPLIILIQ